MTQHELELTVIRSICTNSNAIYQWPTHMDRYLGGADKMAARTRNYGFRTTLWTITDELIMLLTWWNSFSKGHLPATKSSQILNPSQLLSLTYPDRSQSWPNSSLFSVLPVSKAALSSGLFCMMKPYPENSTFEESVAIQQSHNVKSLRGRAWSSSR